jgi:hypothetical protein
VFACCYIPLLLTVEYNSNQGTLCLSPVLFPSISVECESQTKVLDAAEGYCEVIMSNIPVNRTDRELQ